MSEKMRAGLVGVTGYTGMELVRILATHPKLEIVQVTSRKEAGQRLRAIYPFLQGMAMGELTICQPDLSLLAKECDIVFLAIPHGAAMEMGADLVDHGCKVVDLSADFRIRDKTVYEEWYKVPHTRAHLIDEAVYGLPELYADKVRPARLVANPGCYPTASILGLYPALKHGLVHHDNVVIDAKSGTTGAGRGLKVNTLFCEMHDTFRAYGLGTHRHTPEIEQELSLIAGAAMTISFNPHILPVNRGILATMYTTLKSAQSLEEVHAIYSREYKDHSFVRVLPQGALPELRNVRGTMLCDIGLVVDKRTNRLIVVSVIDNLCRGASGQAVANANLMLGLPLESGLNFAPLVP